MHEQTREFLDAWSDTKETCTKIGALLTILRAYCDENSDEDRRFFYIVVLLDILSNLNLGQVEQINEMERCANNFL